MQTPMDSLIFETASSCGDLTALSNHGSPMKPIFDENMAKNRRSSLNTSAPIDAHKYRTKLCRNHVMGIRCPFEDRCVFAHGEEQMRPSSGLASPAPEMNPVALSAAAVGNNHQMLSPATPPSVAITPMAMSNINSPQKVQAAPPLPPMMAPKLPSYENFMHSAAAGVYAEPASPLESRPDTPPSPLPQTGAAPFPNRFRYDPYVLGGIVFEN